MKQLVRRIARDVQTALNGLAYAHIEEYRSTAEKIRLLSTAGLQPLARGDTRSAPPKTVVLAIKSRLEPGALKYALSMSQRMNASLDVLCVAGRQQAKQALAPYLETLASADVPYRLIMSNGTVPSAISKYVAKQPEILAAIAGSGDVVEMLDIRQNRRTTRSDWTSNFPLVIVAEHA